MLDFLRSYRSRDVVYDGTADRASAPERTTMTTTDDGKAFLRVCLAQRLLDQAQAKKIWSQAHPDSGFRFLIEGR